MTWSRNGLRRFGRGRLRSLHVPYEQGNAPDVVSGDCDVDAVKPSPLKTQLLNVDDEIARNETRVLRHGHVHRDVDAWHDQLSVLVHEVELNLFVAFLHFTEDEAQGDGTLRMHGRQLTRVDRVERAKDVQLAVRICRCITQSRDLNVHTGVSLGRVPPTWNAKGELF